MRWIYGKIKQYIKYDLEHYTIFLATSLGASEKDAKLFNRFFVVLSLALCL